MPNKLQELTDKLYSEGLNRGREEGERLLASSKDAAARIIADAKAEAARIIEEAEAKAAEIRTKSDADIRMASQQALQATKKDIENVIVGNICSDRIPEILSDDGFLKAIITEVASRFSASESADISLILPESLKDRLEPWVGSELRKTLGKGVKAGFSKKISGGFTIGPGDGSWFISLTDDSFSELISEYLRPVTRKLLFGE